MTETSEAGREHRDDELALQFQRKMLLGKGRVRRAIAFQITFALVVCFLYLNYYWTWQDPQPDMLDKMWERMLNLGILVITFYYVKAESAGPGEDQ